MKVTWEAGDILHGSVCGKPGCNEKWLIGYRADVIDAERYVLVSYSDGLVTGPYTKEDLAVSLTINGYVPMELFGKYVN